MLSNTKLEIDIHSHEEFMKYLEQEHFFTYSYSFRFPIPLKMQKNLKETMVDIKDSLNRYQHISFCVPTYRQSLE